MKKLSLFLIVVCFALSSCVKEDDFIALQHPISIQGEISPTLGIPVGYGSATIHDLLTMIQESESYVEVDEYGVINLTYSYDTLFVVEIDEESKGGRPSTKEDTSIVHLTQKSFQGSYDIDLFENIDIPGSDDIEVDSILVNFWANVDLTAEDGATERIEQYHVHVYYDSLFIDILGKDNIVYHIFLSDDTINIDSILHGRYRIDLFKNTDISDVVNKKMKQIRYGGRMNVAFEAEFYNMSAEEFVTDSIGISAINIDGHLNVRFPLSTYINDITYETSIEVNESFTVEDIVVDSSHLYFQFINGIPLNLNVTADIIDDAGNKCNIIDSNTVAGAKVGYANGRYVAQQADTSLFDIEVTRAVWDAMQTARKINIKAHLSTSGANRAHVAIRDTDKLEFKLWAKAHATMNLNIDVTGGNNNGEEGGEQ